MKSRFLNSIGFNCAAAEMVDGALARYTATTDRISLFEEQAFLWAEGGRGDRALECADVAVGLGSNSVRTHYLRGRALALAGQLQNARLELLEVLRLDPDNADAHRALPMIDAAIRPKVTKPW